MIEPNMDNSSQGNQQAEKAKLVERAGCFCSLGLKRWTDKYVLSAETRLAGLAWLQRCSNTYLKDLVACPMCQRAQHKHCSRVTRTMRSDPLRVPEMLQGRLDLSVMIKHEDEW